MFTEPAVALELPRSSAPRRAAIRIDHAGSVRSGWAIRVLLEFSERELSVHPRIGTTGCEMQMAHMRSAETAGPDCAYFSAKASAPARMRLEVVAATLESMSIAELKNEAPREGDSSWPRYSRPLHPQPPAGSAEVAFANAQRIVDVEHWGRFDWEDDLRYRSRERLPDHACGTGSASGVTGP